MFLWNFFPDKNYPLDFFSLRITYSVSQTESVTPSPFYFLLHSCSDLEAIDKTLLHLFIKLLWNTLAYQQNISKCYKVYIFFFFLMRILNQMRMFDWLIDWLILAVLGLRFCARAFSSCGKRGPLFIAMRGPLSLRSTGSRRAGSAVVAHGPSRSAACGIFPGQGSNPCPLH